MERFRAITSSYYRGTQGILLGTTKTIPDFSRVFADLNAVVTVYDITNRESYGALDWWFAERSRHVPESTVKIIVGAKADKVRLEIFPVLPWS